MQLVSVEVGSVNPVKPCPKPINRMLEYEHHVPVDKNVTITPLFQANFVQNRFAGRTEPRLRKLPHIPAGRNLSPSTAVCSERLYCRPPPCRQPLHAPAFAAQHWP